MKTKSGELVVIDGTDGSGKATQTALLEKRLRKEKIKVKTISFPRYTDTVFGRLLRECLDGKHGDFLAIDPRIASTLYAADRFETSVQIRKWLEAGYVVICDRYVSANQIHQGGKIKDDAPRREFLKWLDTIEFRIFKIPRPDLIVYLHVPLEVSLALIEKRASAGQKKDAAESDAKHLYESQQSALAMIREFNNWLKIDCAVGASMRTPEEIHGELFLLLKKKFRW